MAVSGLEMLSGSNTGLPAMPVDACCFFLDVDGTLIDFADHPDAVRVPAQLRSILSQLLAATDGAVALISGRRMSDLEHLFAPLQMAAAAQHGLERRDAAGRRHDGDASPPRLAATARELDVLVARHPGLLLEDKGSSLALHYRQAPDLATLVHQVMGGLAGDLGEGFEMLPGKMVVEIKAAGSSKGTAIDMFMREAPFKGRTAVFAGDDATDETGFAVVNRLGGHSVKVGAGASAARWRIADPGAVRRWLGGLVCLPLPQDRQTPAAAGHGQPKRS